ncbi:hypothetical protein HYS28_02550, partial [Candidatus Uhrbacteria bacterium]|nr:hypothetical protein [Candidatus Uhrbacteria bacterium]
RHAEKGYPRFYFSVSAGRRYNTFDLPVWRPMQGDGWLVQRLDDIRTLRQHGVSVPESAYWMDVQIGITQKGAPRLEPMRQGQKAIPAILTKRGEGAMSQGKWGWSNQVHSAVEKSEQGGSKIVWSTYVSSSGGGVHRTFDLLLIAQGGSIGMSNGTAITFNGREIVKVAGGALPTQNDPSRGEVPTEIPCQDRGKEDQTYLDPQGKNPSVCEKCGEQYSPYKHVSEVLVPHWTTRHPDSGMIRH